MKKMIKIIVLILVISFGNLAGVCAQTGNFGAGYFQNQYLFNPAMIGGNNSQLNINAAYKKESTSISGGPKTMYLTVDYTFNKAVGLGMNLISDKIGPASTTKMMVSYAYQLQFNGNDQRVLFGMSVGGVIEKFNANEIVGDPTDAFLYNLNDRGMQFEADFGAAYIHDDFTMQATFPNLVSAFRNKERTALNLATLFAAASYKFKLSEGHINLEPKVAYRSFKKLKSIIDAGINVDLKESTISIYGMYHSNNSVTGGIGFKLLDAMQLSGSYTSSSNSFKGGSIGNIFEVGLRFYTSRK